MTDYSMSCPSCGGVAEHDPRCTDTSTMPPSAPVPRECRLESDCLLSADGGVCADGLECRDRQQREAERVHERRARNRLESE